MNIQQLDYIVAVDTYRHFSRAAEACFVTQPTLSMMIQKLEDELGVKVFDRSKSPVAPTAIGEKIIEQARIVISQVGQITQIIDQERGIISGTFRLGIIPTVAPYLLPRLMHIYATNSKDIRICVEETTTAQAIEKLHKAELDGAILATPLNESALNESPLYYERFFAYISPSEKALYAKTSLEESDLTAAKLWMLDEVHCFRTQILHLCNLRETRRQPSNIFTYEAGSIDTLINIIDQNEGLTIIPEMALDNLSEAQRKNVRPFTHTTPVREISLVTHKDFIRDNAVKAIKDKINEAIPESFRDDALKKYIVPL